MRNKVHIGLCQWLLPAMLVVAGCFHEYVAAAASAVLAVALLVKIAGKKQMLIRLNLAGAAMLLTVLGYLFTVIYAVDRGMAFTGFFKVLPPLLFFLLVTQEEGGGASLLDQLPLVALGLGVLSFVAQWIPGVGEYFVVSGRLAGFFQYPNAFAAFLLVGELLLWEKREWKWYDLLHGLLLLALLMMTGSRTVFVLAVAANLVLLFWRLGKRGRIALVAAAAAVIVAVALCLPLLQSLPVVGRYFTISVLESTFVGRLLYFYDALPLVLRHPFGLGYMGYYYLQRSIQSGLYSIKYIHNDLLQLALDVGWIPCLAWVAAVIRGLMVRGYGMGQKVALAALAAHCLFDFDLQFSAMLCVFLLLLGPDRGKTLTFRSPVPLAAGGCGVLALLSAYFAVALGLPYWGQPELADAMYGANTENRITLMIEETDLERRTELADEILRGNSYAVIAYSAKAQYAYTQGDFQELIELKHRIFQLAPFGYEEYEEYCYMLAQGLYLYQEQGDLSSAEVCREELIETRDKVHGLDQRLSDLGRLIVDQPQTELPEDLELYIDQLEGME